MSSASATERILRDIQSGIADLKVAAEDIQAKLVEHDGRLERLEMRSEQTLGRVRAIGTARDDAAMREVALERRVAALEGSAS